jgi:hypothetical protein
VPLDVLLRHHALHGFLLLLARLVGGPHETDQHRLEQGDGCPGARRKQAQADRQQGEQSQGGDQEAERDRQVYDRRVQGVGQHAEVLRLGRGGILTP